MAAFNWLAIKNQIIVHLSVFVAEAHALYLFAPSLKNDIPAQWLPYLTAGYALIVAADQYLTKRKATS